jgi:hypothetical protein
VVRETRRVKHPTGDGATAVEQARGRFAVLEQNYRYDLLTPAKLLEKHVGKRINVYRYNDKTRSEEKREAEVLSVEWRHAAHRRSHHQASGTLRLCRRARVCSDFECEVREVGREADHVHLLIGYPPKVATAKHSTQGLPRRMKDAVSAPEIR